MKIDKCDAESQIEQLCLHYSNSCECGMVPGYTGHINSLKEEVGKTFGAATCTILSKSKPKLPSSASISEAEFFSDRKAKRVNKPQICSERKSFEELSDLASIDNEDENEENKGSEDRESNALKRPTDVSVQTEEPPSILPPPVKLISPNYDSQGIKSILRHDL